MKPAVAAAFVLAACAEAQEAPKTGGAHRTLPFAAVAPDPDGAGPRSAVHCVPDRSWCAQLRRDGGQPWMLHVFEGAPADDGRRFEPANQRSGDPVFAIWPRMVSEAGGAVLIGVLTTRRMGFSGGGASETWLTLVRVEPAGVGPVDVLEVPVEASSLVRACFGEGDIQLRAEACHDEYAFAGNVTLDPAAAEGRPLLTFTTRARTYPGRAFRLNDEEAAERERRQWRRAELAWADDPECSYRLTFRFDAAAGRYRPDRPLPECSDYLGHDWPAPLPPR